MEVYAHRDCPMRELTQVMDAFNGHMSKGQVTANDITRYTKEGKTELKRCEVVCSSHEEAVELAEKLRSIEKVVSVLVVEESPESVDYQCTIL